MDRHPPAGLENLIDDQWRLFPGKTGVAIMRIDGGWVTGQRLRDMFPQQSVSKTWVAMTVLDLVDQGKLSLDQKVRITRDDLAVFHQPIRDRVLANGVIEESVLSLLEQAIMGSDNTANDSLLRTAGGPQAVRDFLGRKNLGAIRFGPGERAMQSKIAGLEWQQDYSVGRRFYSARDAVPLQRRKMALDEYLANPVDGASPEAIVKALARLAKGELLSAGSTRLMLDIMSRTSSGPNRLKAGVPAGWRFLHKTGTGQVLSPVSTGYNDIGIMTAPDGTRYAIAVMMGSTTASIPDRMAFMQFVSRTVATYHQR
ncbi:MAG: serine hydrolase [Sphingorhabdus sp.]